MVVITRGGTGHRRPSVPRVCALCWYGNRVKYEVDVYGGKHKPVGSSGTRRHHEQLNDWPECPTDAACCSATSHRTVIALTCVLVAVSSAESAEALWPQSCEVRWKKMDAALCRCYTTPDAAT